MSPADTYPTVRTRPRPAGAHWRFLCGLSLLACAAALPIATKALSDARDRPPAGVGAATPAQVATNWDSVYASIQERYTQVIPIVKHGCYDCHSSETMYPWYHKLPIIKGLMDGDIKNARRHLDFSNGFPFKGHSRAADNLLAMRNEVLEGDMPPLYYRILHWSARPSGADRDSLIAWIDTSLRTLATHGRYPLGRPDLVPTKIETGK